MKRSILCLSVLLTLIISNSTAQEPSRHSNRFDADLYNGTIYNYGSAHIKGHQFLEKEVFDSGSVTIGSQSFSGLLMNYDIYNQEVLFKSGEGFQQKIISLPVETIRSFTIGNRSFIIVHEENQEARIFETIGEQDLKFARSWSKDLLTSNDNSIYNFKFSKPAHTTFLSDGESLDHLNSRKDLLKAFPESYKSELKKFMRKSKIRFRKASSIELLKLINYSYTL
jgi:hypothetical protein